MRFFSNDKDARDDQQAVDVQERADEVNPDQAHDDRGPDDRAPYDRAPDDRAPDDRAPDDRAEDGTGFPEHVQSDPVAVPQQRAGSPWSSTPDTTPDTADDEPADRERRDDIADTADTTTGSHDGDTPPFHEPAAQPTAFGAATVGGAVAASAAAGPGQDRWDDTDRRSDADSGVADDRSVAPGDGVVDDRDGTPGDRPAGATAVTSGEVADRPTDDNAAEDIAAHATPADSGREDPVDVALDDRGTFDDPQVLDQEAAREDHTPPDHAAADTAPDAIAGAYAESRDADETSDSVTGPDATLRDEGGFDDPKAVDPATDQPLDDSTPVAAAAGGVAGAAAAGVAGAASAGDTDTDAAGNRKPGTVDAPDLGKLFGDDAASFRERWREVQLRFVDSPKEATAEAAGLVDEVVDKLTASLKSQRAALTGDGSDDTERLRVELRAYRDFLNRLLDL